MTGRDRVLAAFRREPLTTPPWVPFTGVHVGQLTGTPADVLYRDGDALHHALLEAHRLYQPDGMPAVFDLQLEAEALGCELLWAPKVPPMVVGHPLAGGGEPRAFDPTAGRVPLAVEAIARLEAAVGDRTAVFGLLCGPFTLASHLRGTDLFLDMFDDEAYVDALLAHTTDVALRMADLYVDAGADVVAAVDPLVSQISPEHFERFLSAPFGRLFDHLRGRGAVSSFFVCGDATRNLDVMCRTRPDGVSIDENVDLLAAKVVADRHGVALGGNVPLTTVMLFGSQLDNLRWSVDLLDAVAAADVIGGIPDAAGSADATAAAATTRGLIVSPGCDLPYDVPRENVVAVGQGVRHPEAARVSLRDYARVDEDAPVALPDYAALQRPLVEVFTLDADTCAACTYMLRTVLEAKTRFGTAIDVAEYRFTRRGDVARTKAMGVKQLPSIYVDGELAYASIIPSRDALDAVLARAVATRRAAAPPRGG
jgi:uroporphyrinogen decarboxylase